MKSLVFCSFEPKNSLNGLLILPGSYSYWFPLDDWFRQSLVMFCEQINGNVRTESLPGCVHMYGCHVNIAYCPISSSKRHSCFLIHFCGVQTYLMLLFHNDLFARSDFLTWTRRYRGFSLILCNIHKILTPRLRQPKLQGALCTHKLDIVRRSVKRKFWVLT